MDSFINNDYYKVYYKNPKLELPPDQEKEFDKCIRKWLLEGSSDEDEDSTNDLDISSRQNKNTHKN